MKKPFRLFLVVFVVLLSAISCKKDKKGTPDVSLTVVTKLVPDSDIYAYKAILGATATIENAAAGKGEPGSRSRHPKASFRLRPNRAYRRFPPRVAISG